MSDNVNHPSHYTAGSIECIDALQAATDGLEGIEAVCTANAIKYLWRWKHKNGVEDLQKAIWYIERLIKEIEKTTETRREKLQREHPEMVKEHFTGGCRGCPSHYGYAAKSADCNTFKPDEVKCRKCWDGPVEN